LIEASNKMERVFNLLEILKKYKISFKKIVVYHIKIAYNG